MEKETKRNYLKIIFKILIYKILFILFFLIIFFGYLYYIKNISPLPDVRDYKSIPMYESSIIYDRNGEELYKVYEEKRTYVKYEDISKNMINAIVAGEDKRFWTHNGYDAIGIFRSFVNGILNNTEFSGTSGITQQLAKVTYLNNERSINRKIKELYLSIEIDSIFEKKDILELYLNKIFFGGNSYGVEQASQTYFGKNAKNLDILESSILASLPKAPSGLSPYNHREKLLGYLSIKKEDEKIDILSKKDFYENTEKLKPFISFINNLSGEKKDDLLNICGLDNLNFKYNKIDNNGCTDINYNSLLGFLNNLYFENNGYIFSYQTGRKDYVLGRMLEDGYITFDEYKKSIIQGLGFQFNPYLDEIKSPHFVMYVLDYLFENYSEEEIKRGGYKIYTTIDSDLQDKAQEIIEKQVEINIEKFGATNAALISIDNKTGEIISMVGGVDYFDKSILGFNNIIFSRLQPGSTFKPFIYLLSMIKNGYTKDTIFTDEEFTFPGDYSPGNSDGKYMGKMTLSKALNYSRNIPAVKNYYVVGEEQGIIDFLEPFGMNSLMDFKEEFKQKYGYYYTYSAPMALGTVQITPFELASSYSVLANNGVKKDIKFITKIQNFNGDIIEDNTENKDGTRLFDEKYAVEMNKILSNKYDRPETWNYFLTIPDRKISAKTGTSSKQYKQDGDEEESIFAKDLWTVGYTPQITTVVWAGNNSGEKLKEKSYGLTGAGPIMRDFMNYAHKDLEVIDL